MPTQPLPQLVKCPGCQRDLKLSAEEQTSNAFVCPACGEHTDVGTDEAKFRELLANCPAPIFFPASNGKRFANLCIDNIIATVANGVSLGAVASISETLFGNGSIVFVLLASLVLPFLYYFVGETSLQKTPAKYITRTRVVNKDGSKPATTSILKRTLSRFVPFEAFSGSDGTWWHDRWSNTMVVDD